MQVLSSGAVVLECEGCDSVDGHHSLAHKLHQGLVGSFIYLIFEDDDVLQDVRD